MMDSFEDSSARLKRLQELARQEKDPMKYYEIEGEIRRVLDERQLVRNSAEVLQKLSDARWIQYQHESEKQSWPMWKRLIHRLVRCGICRTPGCKRLDHG